MDGVFDFLADYFAGIYWPAVLIYWACCLIWGCAASAFGMIFWVAILLPTIAGFCLALFEVFNRDSDD